MAESIKKNWLLYLIVFQPFLDIIAYFQQDNVIGSFAGYSRLLFMCILPVIVLIKTEKKKSFIILMGIIALYSIMHIFNCFRVGYISVFQDIAYLARVIQMPVLAISLIYYINSDEVKGMVSKAFAWNLITIIISMVLAYLSGTAEATYNIYGYGLMGWFANANAQSIIVVSLIPLALYYIALKKNVYLMGIGLLISWFLLISNGTKVAYYSIFIIFGGFILFEIIYKLLHHEHWDIQRWTVLGLLLLFLGISVVGYPLTPRYKMTHFYDSTREEDQTKMDEELKEVTVDNLTLDELLMDAEKKAFIIEYYTPLLNEDLVNRFGAERVLREYGYLPSSRDLSDVRRLKRMYSKMVWEESDQLTKFVGFEYSNIHGYDLENDYPAIFYYYGYIGFGLYAIFILYFIYLIFKTTWINFKSVFTPFNFALLLTFALQLGAAEFSGAILRRPNVSIYLSIILVLVYYQCKQNTQRRGKQS